LGQTVGPATEQVFGKVLDAKPHPEMGYRSCLGILRLSNIYFAERVDLLVELGAERLSEAITGTRRARPQIPAPHAPQTARFCKSPTAAILRTWRCTNSFTAGLA